MLQNHLTPNFAKYLSKILDIFLFTKNCFVYAFSQFFDWCDVTHFGPEHKGAEDGSAVPANKIVMKCWIKFNYKIETNFIIINFHF